MRATLIIALIVASLAVVFSIQNSQPVMVNFLKWYFEASLVVVLLITFIAGVITAFLVSIPWRIRKMREVSHYRKGQGEQ